MKKVILIFDDDQELLFVSKRILEKHNYHVETRSICDNILEDFIALKPDIILMDLWIPHIGGEKAADILKSHSLTKNVPVIFFSANNELERITLKAGAGGYLKKPFEIAVLLKTIETNISATA